MPVGHLGKVFKAPVAACWAANSSQMVRDFLGMSGKDSESLGRDEGRVGRQDSVFGGPAMQWPFSNRISAFQQFMSYKAGQEERAKKLVYNQLASSGFQPINPTDAFEANYKASPVQAQQKCFTSDRQGTDQFSMQAYQSSSTNASGVPMHHLNDAKSSQVVMHHSIPVATSSPFFQVHGSPNGPNLAVTSSKQQPLGGGFTSNAPVAGSPVGSFIPRSVAKPPPTAQLTIFYAGSVNVYDEVPLDKAQAIMFMASKGVNASSNALNPRPETPATSLCKVTGVGGLSMNQTQVPTPTPNPTPTPTPTPDQTPTLSRVQSSCSGIASPRTVTSHAVSQPGSGSSATEDLVGTKSSGPATSKNLNEPSKTAIAASGSPAPVSVMPRAIPQARKASLARFLEKRKERVTNAAPYASTKKSEENSVGEEGPPSKSSSNNIGLLSNRGEPCKVSSQHKNFIGSGDPPSTKLEM